MADRISKDRTLDRPALDVAPTAFTAELDSSVSAKAVNKDPVPDHQIDRYERRRDVRGGEKSCGPVTQLDKISKKGDGNGLVKCSSNSMISASIWQWAAKEDERQRPLFVIKDCQSCNGNYWVGYDFLKFHILNSRMEKGSFDSTSLYDDPDMNIGVFFGEKNESYREVSLQLMLEKDSEGELLHSLLKVNADITYRPDMLRAMALTSAVLKAGYFGPISEEDARQPIDRLAPQDRRDALGFALIDASRGPFYEIAEIVLDWGAEVNSAADDDGSSPLGIALCSEDIKLAELLLRYGADPDEELVSGMTSREVAKDRKLLEFQRLFDGPKNKNIIESLSLFDRT